MPTDPRDIAWMQAALALAESGLGKVAPNPAVACLIVRDDRLIARAVTAPGGRPHAESQALDLAGKAARGATAYVTLEPCAHQGQTPPCAKALIAAGVARVVVAIEDPDVRVAGRGVAMLRDAGIAVDTGICQQSARELNAGYFKHRLTGLPFLTLKLAATLDGRIATKSGESRWISGPRARADVHRMRDRHDAVLIGSGTALADDPMLDVRGMGPRNQPTRVILDSGLRIPDTARLVATAGAQRTILICGEAADPKQQSALRRLGAEVVPVALRGASIDATAALKSLAEMGVTRVFCEGGGTLAASLIREGLVDELVLYSAGKAIGADGVPVMAPLQLDVLGEAPQFALIDLRRLGGDLRATWRPAPDYSV